MSPTNWKRRLRPKLGCRAIGSNSSGTISVSIYSLTDAAGIVWIEATVKSLTGAVYFSKSSFLFHIKFYPTTLKSQLHRFPFFVPSVEYLFDLYVISVAWWICHNTVISILYIYIYIFTNHLMTVHAIEPCSGWMSYSVCHIDNRNFRGITILVLSTCISYNMREF
jgi:hypothetical protein